MILTPKKLNSSFELKKRDPDFDSKENTFPGADSSASTLCPEKYKLSTKVEVESIEDIIRKAKENFKDSQSEIMVKLFFHFLIFGQLFDHFFFPVELNFLLSEIIIRQFRGGRNRK